MKEQSHPMKICNTLLLLKARHVKTAACRPYAALLRWEPMLSIYIPNEGHVSSLSVLYLLILHDTQYRTCESLQECSLQWEGHTLIYFEGARVSSRCCVLMCKPCMLVVRHTLRISVCVSEKTCLLHYLCLF
jgi:hypothetical protein